MTHDHRTRWYVEDGEFIEAGCSPISGYLVASVVTLDFVRIYHDFSENGLTREFDVELLTDIEGMSSLRLPGVYYRRTVRL